MTYTDAREHGQQQGVCANRLEYSEDGSVHQAAAYLSRAAANSQKNLLPISTRALSLHSLRAATAFKSGKEKLWKLHLCLLVLSVSCVCGGQGCKRIHVGCVSISVVRRACTWKPEVNFVCFPRFHLFGFF